MHGHIVSGASTLTMQAVRLLERRPRTLRSKLIEMAEALGLERRFSKDRILGLYLTLAPFGGNLEGVRAASLAYFGKEPRPPVGRRGGIAGRIAALAGAAAPRPAPRSGLAGARRGAGAHAGTGRHHRTDTRRGARRDRAASAAVAAVAGAASGAGAARPRAPLSTVQRTTIDPMLQREVETLLRREAAALDPQATLAALVIDNRTRDVLAYAGNADFLSARRRGIIDMARAVRSPGSTLKPFIYAMAFDRLILHPQTMLDDRQRQFGDYAPGDFDGHFQGEVTRHRGVAIFAERARRRGARPARSRRASPAR